MEGVEGAEGGMHGAPAASPHPAGAEQPAEASAGDTLSDPVWEHPAAWQAGASATLILALDTSTQLGGVALCRGAALLGEETWQSVPTGSGAVAGGAGGQQTTQILPAAERLWTRAGLQASDLGAVAVATGPGSFTGLRVGLSLAKGFALALGVPLVGVPTLDVIAYQHRLTPAPLCALIGAGRGRYYAGFYRHTRAGLHREGAFAVLDLAELAQRLTAAATTHFLCGELEAELVAGLAEHLRRLRPKGGRTRPVRYASPAATVRRPAYLAELARGRLDRQEVTDPAALQPLYLRR